MQIFSEVFKPVIDDISVSFQNIEQAMGYTKNNIPGDFKDQLEQLFKEAIQHVNLCTSYVFFPPGSALSEAGRVEINGSIFKTGRIISGQIKKMDSAAVFTATIGSEFDKWSRKFFDEGDPFSAFTADLIGSELAESLADFIEQKISEKARQNAWGCSNRYSPGYCGWDVSEQHKLFDLFPENLCEIKLTDSALMQPIKSVSGIIAIGPQVVKKEYQCHICDIDFCYKRHEIKMD